MGLVVVVIVVVDPRNLPLKVGQNRVINRQDLVGVVIVVGGLIVVVVFSFCC